MATQETSTGTKQLVLDRQPGYSMFKIKYEGGGEVPECLKGLWTRQPAEVAIRQYEAAKAAAKPKPKSKPKAEPVTKAGKDEVKPDVEKSEDAS